MEKSKRVHPIYIIEGLRVFLFLLIIPLLRAGIYYIINGGIYSWVKGSWLDISVIMVIILLSVIKWHNYKFYCNDHNFIIKHGIFITNEIIIPKKNISYVSLNTSFYFKPLRAITFKCKCFSTNNKNMSISIIVKRSDLNYLKSNLMQDLFIEKNNSKKISFLQTIQIASLSLILSNSFAGILFISAFISNSSKILGEQFQEHVYGSFTKITKAIAFGFHPTGATIAYILIIGWLVAFIKNLITYINFNMYKVKNHLITSSGIINYKLEYLDTDHINYIDIVQNIFTKIIKLYSTFVYLSGIDKNKKGLITIIPASNEKDLIDRINILCNNKNRDLFKPKVKPKKSSWFSYTSLPILFFTIITLILIVLILKYKNWTDFLYFIILMNGIICLLFLIVKIIDLFTAGILEDDKNYIIRYSQKFRFHTIIIPKHKISQIKVNQNILQKMSKRCNIEIHPYAITNIRHTCKNVDTVEVEKFLSLK